MRFLIEKSILSDTDQINYDSLSSSNKEKFVDKFLKNHPNYNNFKYYTQVCKESILENGFDTDDNPFLEYFTTIKYPTTSEVASLIKGYMGNGEIRPNSNWLYDQSLYSESSTDTAYKVKAFVYASNKKYQQDANQKITPEYLYDSRNKMLDTKSMRDKLSKITVESDDADKLTILNAINKLYKVKYSDLNNTNVQTKLKDAFKGWIKEDAKYTPNMDKIIDSMDINDLMRVPISKTTKQGIVAGLINFLVGNSRLVNFNVSNKSNAKSGVDIQSIAKKLKIPVNDLTSAADTNANKIKETTIDTLITLGLKRSQAQELVNNAYTDGADLEQLLYKCLAGLG